MFSDGASMTSVCMKSLAGEVNGKNTFKKWSSIEEEKEENNGIISRFDTNTKDLIAVACKPSFKISEALDDAS